MHTFIFYRRNILCTPVYRVISKGGFTYNHIGSSTPGGLYPKPIHAKKHFRKNGKQLIDFLTTIKTMINFFPYFGMYSLVSFKHSSNMNLSFIACILSQTLESSYLKNAWTVFTSNQHYKSSTLVWYIYL